MHFDHLLLCFLRRTFLLRCINSCAALLFGDSIHLHPQHKPSDLLAELQGRLPIRVELKGLEASDLERILTETKFSLLQQQMALLAAEGIKVEFTPDAVKEIARLAAEVNRNVENIGARRLHTVIERIMEEISFTAPDLPKGSTVTIDKPLVRSKLMPLLEKQDLSKFIL